MTSSVSVLLDAPPAATVSRHRIAKLGRFKDARYGEFAITEAMVGSWRRNLAASQDGRAPIDLDHAADTGGSTRALGWITGIELDRDGPVTYVAADVEWTPAGRQVVADREYSYFSVSFTDHLRDEQGADHGPALVGAALTNRPFLRLPAISLSAASGGEGFAIELPGIEEAAAVTTLQTQINEAERLMREEGIDFVGAMERAGWQPPTLLRYGGSPRPSPVVDGDPQARVKAVSEETEDLKAALAVDLSVVRNTAIMRAALEVLQRGPQLDVVPWLELRRLPEPPRPWSVDDWERDQRRAARADLDLDRESWGAYAELGEDAVAVEFDRARLAKIDQLAAAIARYDGFEREREAAYRRQLAQFQADERTLLAGIGREERLLAASRGGSLDAGGAQVSNGRLEELRAGLQALRESRPVAPGER